MVLINRWVIWVMSTTRQKKERKEERMSKCVEAVMSARISRCGWGSFHCLDCWSVHVVGWAMTPLLSSLLVVVQMLWPWLHPSHLGVHWTVCVQLYHSLCPVLAAYLCSFNLTSSDRPVSPTYTHAVTVYTGDLVDHPSSLLLQPHGLYLHRGLP